jgi:hypothetical protein
LLGVLLQNVLQPVLMTDFVAAIQRQCASRGFGAGFLAVDHDHRGGVG